MSPTPEAGQRRAEALHVFATKIGELQLLMAPTAQTNELLPRMTAAAVTRGVDDAFAAAVAAGYSATMATAMLAQLLQRAVHVDADHFATAVASLARLRAREFGGSAVG